MDALKLLDLRRGDPAPAIVLTPKDVKFSGACDCGDCGNCDCCDCADCSCDCVN